MRFPTTRLLAGAVLVLLPADAAAQETVASEHVQIDEWEVPWEQSRPRDPYVGPDGRVWFVGQRSHYAAFLDPATGEFERYDLDDGTGPHNLIVDEGGTVWYAGNLVRHIGKLDPETGAIEKFMMPDERARDPHTLVFDGQGDMWFTIQGGNFVGKFFKETGMVELVQAPEVEGGRSRSSRPYGITIDSRDRPWIALFNTNLIATVDPSSMELKTFELPEGSRPRRLVVSSDDRIWYVDYQRGMLGRLDPGSGEVEEWASPGGAESRPYGMAIDGEDRIWFVETGIQPNRFVGFDPETEEYFGVTEVGSGGGTIRHMFFHPDTNSIWFGTDANTIGRASITPKGRRPVS
jgi:virginiamycin B lyase